MNTTKPETIIPPDAIDAAACELAEQRGWAWQRLTPYKQDAYRASAHAALAATLPALRNLVAAEVLEGARDDIRSRRRAFSRLSAHPQYLSALDDAFGLVNNRIHAAQSACESGDAKGTEKAGGTK